MSSLEMNAISKDDRGPPSETAFWPTGTSSCDLKGTKSQSS
jgi:hypothetical protein